MNKNLIQRITVALIGIPIIVWICYQSGSWLKGFLLLVTALGSYEYISVVFRGRGEGARQGLRNPMGVLVWVLSVTVAAVHLYVGIFEAFLSLGASLLLIGMIQALGKESPQILFRELTELGWGVFYVSMLYPFMYHVREFSSGVSAGDGFYWIVALLAVIWSCDTAAMWVGQAFGKTKLAPTVSPNKTVEGFTGGLLFAILAGWLLWRFALSGESALVVIGAALMISLVGQLGDLVESLWKRSVGVKDSSAIIPGHGGILDRFDSLAFAAPALYGYLILVSRW